MLATDAGSVGGTCQHGLMTTPDIRLVPKTDDETARWLPVAMAAYERARRDAGDSPEQAEAARRLSQEQFFPDGRLIDGHFLFTVDVDGDDVGWLWIGPNSGTRCLRTAAIPYAGPCRNCMTGGLCTVRRVQPVVFRSWIRAGYGSKIMRRSTCRRTSAAASRNDLETT